MRFDQQIPVQQADQRAIDILASAVPALSRQKLKHAMDKGAVWIKKGKGEQRLRRATKTLNPPQALHIYYDENLLAKTVPEPTLVADLQAYSVWNKPAGLLAQGTPYGDHCSLLRYGEKYFQPERESFLVHRLDAEATGLMMIAHNRKAAALLSDLFKQRTITKRYQVEVEGMMAAPQEISDKINGKPALTIVEKVLSTTEDTCTLVVKIDTGRKHQIRRHFSALGHPVVGDKKYGSTKLTQPLQLRAIEIAFDCPITNKLQQFTVS
jgi:tRNA pseudouridine32 synthase/23S rRNA pseudouridine746 synthase